MVFNPGVSFFILFHDLDPLKDNQCIFFTQKGFRCRNARDQRDKRRAIELHRAINAISTYPIAFDLLLEYVLSTCCRRAKHRDLIEDIDLLNPLAQRWLNEIRSHANSLASLALEKNVVTPEARTALATPNVRNRTALSSPSPSNHQLKGSTPPSINAIPSTPVSSSPSFQDGSSESPPAAVFESEQLESHRRYNLRRRETVNSTSAQPNSISRPPLSEFRPHVATPGPNDSVSSKLLAPLERRDFETGSLYIFDRASSPGHVKIGWTARSVSGRLDSWSKCGYTPKLLLKVDGVPHAQRVETLTHHELIKEWRRERICKAPHCGKSHQEWFEITRERAEKVVSFWADFMERAQPYHANGRLKAQWKNAVESFDRNKGLVTGKRLLECYEESLVEVALVVAEALPIYKSKDFKQEVKVEEICLEDEPDFERLHSGENTSIRVDSVLVEEPSRPKEEPLPMNNAPHGIQALEKEPLCKAKTNADDEPIHDEFIQMTPVKKEVALENIALPASPVVQP